jgi:hypothetical protein
VPGYHEAVAAVVPFAAADHNWSLRSLVQEHLRSATTSILHQHNSGYTECFDGSLVEKSNLMSAEEHRG